VSRSLRDATLLAASIGGYAFTAALLVTGFGNGQWPFPGGDVVAYFEPAGTAVRNGTEVYVASPDFPGFRYGPPWAIAFAGLGLGGAALIHALILVLDVVALWVIAGGSPRRIGLLLWFPLISFELAAGQLNLLIAAALVLAQRGVVWPLAAVSLAKVWPVLAVRPSDLTRLLLAGIAIAVVTVPWLGLWPEWIGALVGTADAPHGPLIPIPLWLRLVLAGGLLVLRRPWSRALGASLASPNLYWGQLVVLVAPIALWFEGRRLSSLEPHGPAAMPNLSPSVERRS
jgi:hypothetical protein